MRRAVPQLLALALGVAVALLAGCGEGGAGRIPAGDSANLREQLEDVRARVESGRCDELQGQLRQIDDAIDQLPPTVDSQLVGVLRDGAERLRGEAFDECNENQGPETTPAETATQPPPTQTQTTPPSTTETQTTPTTTTPTQTPPPPPPPVTEEPPAEPPPVLPPPPPPPENPGGGTPPELDGE